MHGTTRGHGLKLDDNPFQIRCRSRGGIILTSLKYRILDLKTETPDRFFDLAMMKIAGHASSPQLDELEGLLLENSELRKEYEQLARESRLMIELMPMIREAQTAH